MELLWSALISSGMIDLFYKTERFVSREVSLLFAVFTLVLYTLLYTLLSRISTVDTLLQHQYRNLAKIQDKQLADAKEAHRRHVATLQHDHNTQVCQLQSDLHAANIKLRRLQYDYDYISHMYQDQMRLARELEERIGYLEDKFQERGQLTPDLRPPYSAPSTQINFSNPPRRYRVSASIMSPTVSSPLFKVVEDEEDEEVEEDEEFEEEDEGDEGDEGGEDVEDVED